MRVSLKKYVLIPFILLLIISSGYVSADVYVDYGTEYVVGNETYTATALYFSKVVIADSYIGFNDTFFNISSMYNIRINISYLDENITGLVNGSSALTFNATCLGGTVTFNIDGFDTNHIYSLYRDNVFQSNVTTNGDGRCTFQMSGWSRHEVDIREGGNVTVTPPLVNATNYTYDGLIQTDDYYIYMFVQIFVIILWIICLIFVVWAKDWMAIMLGMLFMAFISMAMYNNYAMFHFSEFLILSFGLSVGVGLKRMFARLLS